MKVLGICGSLRKESWNLKLLRNILDKTADKGVETAYFDLNGVPLFHPDVEALGIPDEAETLRDAVREADAVIIACPEYNGSMTAALKNALEWLSRRGNLLNNKVFLIIGTGPGRSACARMHVHASYSLESEGGFRASPAPRPASPGRQLHGRIGQYHRLRSKRPARPGRRHTDTLH